MDVNKILILTTILPSYNEPNYSTLLETLNILIEEKIDIDFIYLGKKRLENDYDSFIMSKINFFCVPLAVNKTTNQFVNARKVLKTINKYIEKESIKKIYTLFNVEQVENEFINFYKNVNKSINKSFFIHSFNKKFFFENNNIYLFKEINRNKEFKENFHKFIDKKLLKDKKLTILEVNNVDILGRRFNGYDILSKINNETPHSAYQLVIDKLSTNQDVYRFYSSDKIRLIESRIQKFEKEQLSIHSNLSIVGNILENHDVFKNSDLVHYHLIHNTKIPLNMLSSLFSKKPTIMSIHDPWNFTGRCVQPEECKLWKNGCEKCLYLSTEFPMKKDNSRYLWQLKKKIYQNMDIDIVVSTPFMKKMLMECGLTSHFKYIHVIPFGIDLKLFNPNLSKTEAKEKLNIPENDIVLFHRAQEAFKGTNYFSEALKELDTDKNITIITCSTKGLLVDVEKKYNVIDLGTIEVEQLLIAYAACDIFVMPSIGESFGMMAIEAMACGKPVIIFDNTALPDITFAPECGYLVKNKDSKDLKKALKHLIDDNKERERRGKLSRKLAENHYDVEKYNSRMIDLYEKVYKRQKNKKELSDNKKQINYENKDTLMLIKLINTYSKTIFRDEIPPFEYRTNTLDIIPNNENIDYSIESVQSVISEFNKKTYETFIHNDEKLNLVPENLNDYFVNKSSKIISKKNKKNIVTIMRKFGLTRTNLILLFNRNHIFRTKSKHFENALMELEEKNSENELAIEILKNKITDLNKAIEKGDLRDE